jgi:bifunctional non-homologous end joining protein LigD
LITNKSALSIPVKKPKATWVEPVVNAEIEYSAVTDDGVLRAAVFKGLHDDLLPKVAAPKLAPTSRKSKARPHIGVPRENILQLLPEAVVPSKDELASYWRKVSKRALLYLARRPLKLVRRGAWHDLLSQRTASEGDIRCGASTSHREA